MSAGLILSNIREIQILSNEKTAGGLGCLPNIRISLTGEALLRHRIDLMPSLG